jgi:broad specificity phosphatase PhoE
VYLFCSNPSIKKIEVILQKEESMFDHLPELLVYTRHPECRHNVDHASVVAEGIINRHSPLTRVGEIQKQITARYLKETFGGFDLVLCSTFHRTRTIPQAAGYEFTEHSGLDERSLGAWHDLPRDVVLARHPGEDKKYQAARYYEYIAPDGEDCTAVEARQATMLFDAKLFQGVNSAYFSGHGISGLCLRRLLTRSSRDDWGGHGGNRTRVFRICSPVPYYLATWPYVSI